MNIAHIPHKPGVYLFKDRKEKILYVGKAKDLAKRVSQYFSPGSVWKQDMLAKADRVDFIEVRTESEALYLEDNLIKTNTPEYNRLLKGDNSYIYLKITKETFPQLFLTRMRRNDGARYIGPKSNTGDLRKLMHYLRQIYKFRTMKVGEFKQGKLSSDVYFGLDKGRSVIAKYKDDIKKRQQVLQGTGIILDKSYEDYQKEYKTIIKEVVAFFEGNTKKVKEKIAKDLEVAVEKQRFEWCIQLRNILHQIDLWAEKQHVVLSPTYNGTIVSITPLTSFWIIIIVKIFEGKIIDVIREKKIIDEWSINQMKASLESDFSQEFIQREHEQNIILFSDSLKSIKKSDWNEIYDLLEKFIQSYIASTSFDIEDNLTQEMLIALKQRYHLAKIPQYIECIDISHLSGMATSGGLSAMKDGILHKPGYRRYNIKAFKDNKSNYSNDYLSLQEIIVRRFGLTKKQKQRVTLSDMQTNFPDLFVIDGGKGQLSILYELCSIFPQLSEIMKHTTFVSLGKGSARKESSKSKGEKEELYYFDDKMKIHSQPLIYDQADRILTKLRDEAHRFSNAYRKQRMSSEWK